MFRINLLSLWISPVSRNAPAQIWMIDGQHVRRARHQCFAAEKDRAGVVSAARLVREKLIRGENE